MIPAEVLIARAVHHLEAAQMELSAGNFDRAADSITTAVDYLRRAQG